MPVKRMLSCAVLSALTAVAPAAAQGTDVEVQVLRPHFFGASHGTLVVAPGELDGQELRHLRSHRPLYYDAR